MTRSGLAFLCTISVLLVTAEAVDDYYQRGTSADPLEEVVDECSDYSIMRYTIPKGEAKTPHHELGQVKAIQQCIDMCCDVAGCQYAWIFEGTCYSVTCGSSNMNMCKGKHVQFPSTYIRVRKVASSDEDEAMPTEEDLVAVTVDATPSTTMNEMSQTTSDMTTPISTSMMSHHTSNTHRMQMSSSRSPVATPPPTKPPPIGNNHLLHNTIAVAVNDKVVILPQNSVQVFGSTWPSPSQDNPYHYQWTKVSGPASGELVGIHEKTLKLNNLVEGNYSLLLTVYDKDGNYGTHTVNIIVNPEPHMNEPPHVVISPKSGAVYTRPVSTVILDASGSTDDTDSNDVLTFKWELMGGPLQALKENEANWNEPLLKLTNPVEGTYSFKLTVTDHDGLSTIGTTNFTVEAEKDYPPVANAGSSVLIHLPNNMVTLSGDASKDDKGIVKYEWTKVEGKAVDIKGTNSPKLYLTHLEAGVYQFKLVVTDTSGQTSSATVTVDVQEEDNQPPIAKVIATNITIHYPKTVAILNGSLSSDDYQITSYDWHQINGPEDIILEGLSAPVLHVSGLHVMDQSPTIFEFIFTVTDYRNLTNSTICQISYYKDEELLPIADAGKDVVITLPQRTAILNGSLSKDGFGIVSYQWIRTSDSPAAGRVVGDSDHTPILMMTDLINGTYNFLLNVTNKNGKSKLDHVKLTVQNDPNELYIVQIYLDEIIYTFNQSNLRELEDALVLKLGQLHYHIHIQDVIPHNQHIEVEFYVTDNNNQKINSSVIYSSLVKDGPSFKLKNYKAVAVEERVCHNPCSGRGYCDVRTKKCVCSTFWMENPIKANYGKTESNCDWSLLYVILVALGIACLVIIGTWLCCCCCIRRLLGKSKASKRRKIKYAILDHKENEGSLQMFPRGNHGAKNNSLIVSESETEEEILFETNKKKAGDKREKQSLIPKNNNSIKLVHNDFRAEEIKNVKNA